MNDIGVACETAATVEPRLLASKETLRRSSPELSEKRKELLCELLDGMYKLGFTRGVDYMGRQILEATGGSKS